VPSRRRESALLAGLAIVGANRRVPRSRFARLNRSTDRNSCAHRRSSASRWYAPALIPLSLRLSRELGLPGAPLIRGKVRGREITFLDWQPDPRSRLATHCWRRVAGARACWRW